jgi:hypothetical protein
MNFRIYKVVTNFWNRLELALGVALGGLWVFRRTGVEIDLFDFYKNLESPWGSR